MITEALGWATLAVITTIYPAVVIRNAVIGILVAILA